MRIRYPIAWLAAGLVACVGARPRVQLEAADVLRLSTTLRDRTLGRTLVVSGLAGHSAMQVEDVQVTEGCPEARVLVTLGLAHGGTGSFEVTVPLQVCVERVTFGPSRTPVWTRPQP